jgi:hypothetical protein
MNFASRSGLISSKKSPTDLGREQAPQLIALESSNLARAVGDQVLVNSVNVRVQEGEAL